MGESAYVFSKAYVFRVPEGVELISYLSEFAAKNNILLGAIMVLGMLKDPIIGYFDKEQGRYRENSLKGTYELASSIGNISLRDGKPFIHLHVVLGGPNGETYSGHLLRAEVYIAEVIIFELTGGKPLERKQYGSLWLWDVYST